MMYTKDRPNHSSNLKDIWHHMASIIVAQVWGYQILIYALISCNNNICAIVGLPHNIGRYMSLQS